MRRERDTHARPRGDKPGRLELADLIRQDLKFASDECTRAMQAVDIKTMREHLTLAHKFVLAAAGRMKRS